DDVRAVERLVLRVRRRRYSSVRRQDADQRRYHFEVCSVGRWNRERRGTGNRSQSSSATKRAEHRRKRKRSCAQDEEVGTLKQDRRVVSRHDNTRRKDVIDTRRRDAESALER